MVIYVIAINLHRGCGGLDCMVIGFITTCAIIAYHQAVYNFFMTPIVQVFNYNMLKILNICAVF
jgi:hypothetical protein